VFTHEQRQSVPFTVSTAGIDRIPRGCGPKVFLRHVPLEMPELDPARFLAALDDPDLRTRRQERDSSTIDERRLTEPDFRGGERDGAAVRRNRVRLGGAGQNY
jgi:hypothetical protein